MSVRIVNIKMPELKKISRIFSLGFLGCKHSIPAWGVSVLVSFTWLWSLLSAFDLLGTANMPYLHLVWACLWVVTSTSLLIFTYMTSLKWANEGIKYRSPVNANSGKEKRARKYARAGTADKFFGIVVCLLGLLYLITSAVQYGSVGPIGAGGADGGNHVVSVLGNLANQTVDYTTIFQVRRFEAQKTVDKIGIFFSAIALVIFFIPWYQASLMSAALVRDASIQSNMPLNANAHEMTGLDYADDEEAPMYTLNAPLKTRV